PLYIREAGVAWGRYHALVGKALEILATTDASLLAEAYFDSDLLDELAFDPRAYDHGHPVNRRPNYVFGEWDPHHLDNQGRYRRYVARQITLDALLDRVEHPGPLDPVEVLFEAAAVLAGTILMASGSSGNGPCSSQRWAIPRPVSRKRGAFPPPRHVCLARSWAASPPASCWPTEGKLCKLHSCCRTWRIC